MLLLLQVIYLEIQDLAKVKLLEKLVGSNFLKEKMLRTNMIVALL